MDDLRFGAGIRAARIRRGWRQADLASAARMSAGAVSRIERGRLDGMPLSTIRAVAKALEVRVELLPRSRGADFERVVNSRHAALSEAVIALLERSKGWTVRPEVSFSLYGERGIVDLLAWHQARAALLVIELKTAIIDVGELHGTLDRKRRLGAAIAGPLNWHPASVSSCLMVADGMTNRRRIAEHSATFRAALPSGSRQFRAWLRDPSSELRALVFVSDGRPGNVRSGFASVRRVSSRSRKGKASSARPVERGFES